MKTVFLFLTLVLMTSSFAQAKVVKLKLRKSTPVYKTASFDSSVIAKLKRGDTIYGTKRPKASGFGYFHKVRVKKGVYGYIPDTSVVGFKKKGNLTKKRKKSKKKISKKSKRSGGGISGRAGLKKKSKSSGLKARSFQTSLLKERSIGLSFHSLNYKLDTKGVAAKSNELFFGFKLSGSWLTNAPLDLNILFAPSAPSSFDAFTSDASGSVVLTDLSLPLEWARGKHWSVFISIGLALSHYSFDFSRAGVAESSGATEFGGVARLGAGYRFGTFIARLEAQYINVGTDHIGVGASLQRMF